MDVQQGQNAPRHIAVIVGGLNAARSSATENHSTGVDFSSPLVRFLDTSLQLGVQYLTLCINDLDSGDNPPSAEWMVLFELLLSSHEFKEKDISVRFIDNIKHIHDRKIGQITKGECENRAASAGLAITILSGFTGREDIASAIRLFCETVEAGSVEPDEINTDLLGGLLSTNGLPDPDLIIFTDGRQRLDNLLLWQSAYSELAFFKKHWTELTPEYFHRIIEDYAGRERRFGGLKKKKSAETR